MNAIAPIQQSSGFSLLPTNINEAMKLAELMAKARLLPQAVQNPADAFLVINQAMRWGMDPFAVAQEVSVIQGKLMHSGKIVAAAIQSSGVLDGRLHYDYAGSGDDRTVTVRGRLRGEDTDRDVSVRARDAKTQNKVWQTQLDQQLAYHGSRVWARRYAPEVMLGVYTPEEFDAPQQPPMPPPRGPQVEHRPDEAPAIAWTTYSPAGKAIQARDVAHWVKCCTAYVALLEDAAAVVAWRGQMEPIFADLRANEPAAVAHVEGLAQDRMDELAEAEARQGEEG